MSRKSFLTVFVVEFLAAFILLAFGMLAAEEKVLQAKEIANPRKWVGEQVKQLTRESRLARGQGNSTQSQRLEMGRRVLGTLSGKLSVLPSATRLFGVVEERGATGIIPEKPYVFYLVYPTYDGQMQVDVYVAAEFVPNIKGISLNRGWLNATQEAYYRLAGSDTAPGHEVGAPLYEYYFPARTFDKPGEYAFSTWVFPPKVDGHWEYNVVVTIPPFTFSMGVCTSGENSPEVVHLAYDLVSLVWLPKFFNLKIGNVVDTPLLAITPHLVEYEMTVDAYRKRLEGQLLATTIATYPVATYAATQEEWYPVMAELYRCDDGLPKGAPRK